MIKIQDQEEIKAYLVNHINNLWNRNRDFVRVFGRDFPRMQLERNLRELRFNESSPLGFAGEYFLVSRNIHIYNSKNPIYSLHDLLKSPIYEDMMLTLRHELLHAILSKNLDSEKDPNKLRTGLEIYDEVQGRVINSPLNEGYTEYLRDRLDKKGLVTYDPYNLVFYILEKKLGRQGVIALGKGDVAQNLANAFSMTKDEFMDFIRDAEKKFIKERKLEILEKYYAEFCERFPEGTIDSEESTNAIIQFDKEVHKCLYNVSIMDILPIQEGENPTLSQFHELLTYKIDGLNKQNKRFHRELQNTAKDACSLKKRITGCILQFRIPDNTGKKVQQSTDSSIKHEFFVSSLRERANQNEGPNESNVQYNSTRKENEKIDIQDDGRRDF